MKSFAVVLAAAATAVSAGPISAFNEMIKRQASALPDKCTDFSSVAAGTVCITRPTDCTANYTVASGDTCGTVTKTYPNVTATQLWKWNPEIGQSCFGLRAYVPICVSAPGYTFEGQPAPGSTLPATAKPVPVQPNSSANCQTWMYVSETGVPSSTTYLPQNNITKEQFLAWNGNSTPSPDGSISSWGGYYVCVKA